MSFRSDFIQDEAMRFLDFLSHIVASIVICYLFWGHAALLAFCTQWILDAGLPVIFIRSWMSNNWLPRNDPALIVHRVLHSRKFSLAVLLIGVLIICSKLSVFLAIQVFSHRMIDQFTHEENWI